MARSSLTPWIVAGALVGGALLYQRAQAAPALGLGLVTAIDQQKTTTKKPTIYTNVSIAWARAQAKSWAQRNRRTMTIRNMAEFYAKVNRKLWATALTPEFEAVWRIRPPKLARDGVDYWKLQRP